MKFTKYYITLLILSCLLMVSCSNTVSLEEPEVVLYADNKPNQILELKCEDVEKIDLVPNLYGIPLHITRNEAVYFPSGYNLDLSIYDNETLTWKDLKNGISVQFSDTEGYVVYGEGDGSLILISPILEEKVDNAVIRVYIQGNIYQDGKVTSQIVEAYCDLPLMVVD